MEESRPETPTHETRPRPRWRRPLRIALILAALALTAYAARTQLRHAFARGLRAATASSVEDHEAVEVDETLVELSARVRDTSTSTAAPTTTRTPEAPALASTPLPPLGPEAPPPLPQRPKGMRGVSFVLILGLDNRSDRITGRTDTMVIGAFRRRDAKVAAFSVPRDLWIEIPELGPARISSVYRIGEVKLGPGKGLPLLRSVLEREFGVRIDHYAAVDLAGFVNLVDALEGIDVEVQCPIMDCFWSAPDATSCTMLDLGAGRQHLDGETALMYARSRHGRGDRDRTRRQQAVLLAFGRKVVDGGLRRLPELWSLAKPHLQTDLNWEAAAYYGSFALDAPLDQIGGFAITKPLVERHVTEDRKHVLLLQREPFDAAMAELFATRLPGLRERRRCPEADVALLGRGAKDASSPEQP